MNTAYERSFTSDYLQMTLTTGVDNEMDQATLDTMISGAKIAYAESGDANISSKWSKPVIGEILLQLLHVRSNRNQSLDDLEAAIRIGDEIITDSVSGTSEKQAHVMHQLSFMKASLYGIRGRATDINQAIDLGKRAVAAMVLTDIQRPDMLDSLACNLSTRYNATSDIEDLHESIATNREALEVAPKDHPQRFQFVSNLCSRLTKRFLRTSQSEDQPEAIRLACEAVSLTEPESTQRGLASLNLTTLLINTFEHTGFSGDLEEAIRLARLALVAIPTGHDGRGFVLYTLQNLLMRRYDITKELNDLKESIQMSEEAVAATRRGSRHRRVLMTSRATQLKEYFDRTDALDDLIQAIYAFNQAIAEMPENHPNLSVYLKRVISLQGVMFLRSKSLHDWINFLMNLITFITTPPMENLGEKLRDEELRTQTVRKLLSQIGRLGSTMLRGTEDSIGVSIFLALQEEYKKRSETLGPVDAVVDILNGCVDVRFDVHSVDDMDDVQRQTQEVFKQAHAFGLTSVRFRYRLLFLVLHSQSGNEDELPENTISVAGAASSSGHDPQLLQKLSKLHESRFSRTNAMEDLEAAIQYSTVALERILEGNSAHIAVVQKLVSLWDTKYRRVNDLDSLNKAISYAEIAIVDHDESQTANINNLAMLLRRRFMRTAVLDDLDKAVQLAESALVLTSNDPVTSDQRIHIQCTAAMTLKSRYQRKGDAKDLDRCIGYMEDAISASAKSRILKDNGMRLEMLNNYGLIMRLNYQRTHTLSDLDKALEVIQESLEFNPNRSTRPAALNNLGLILYDKYNHTRAIEDIQDAIKYYREALDVIQEGRGEFIAREGILINLGNALAMTGNSRDLDEGIEHASTAAEKLPADFRGNVVKNDLSEMLLTRYERNFDREDIEKSIQCAKDAIDSIAADHPIRALFLDQLGDALAAKMITYPSEETLHPCIQAYTDVWHCEIAEPSRRVHAAWKAGKHLIRDKRYDKAAKMLEDAVKLLPKLGPRWLRRGDQQHQLSSLSGLAADAALVGLLAGASASQALHLLEQGRGVMMGIIMDYRSEITHSGDIDEFPNLLRRFNILRMEADNAFLAPAQQYDPHSSGRFRKATEEMDQILKDIRQLSGHENFLLHPKSKDLMAMAVDGPIIVVTISSIVDPGVAIIVRSCGISSLQLPKLNHAEVTERITYMTKKIVKGSLRTFATRNEKMQDLLLWLWETVVEPVLNEMGFMGDNTAGSSLPRVRWIGVGLLSRLPFHAAGDNLPGSRCNAMDRVISSYLPTLRALAFAQARKPKMYLHQKRDARLLIVLMPETPSAAPLYSADEEASDIIHIAAAASMQQTTLKFPTVSKVLGQLPIHNIVHFACHGVSDCANPSDSCLMLADAKLTVQQILRTHAAEPDIAFLSACSTAHSHDGQLADESIYIASSFQLVGFRHVVGTLWTTDDTTCREVACKFYSHLLGDDKDNWVGSWKVAEALHAAASCVRNREPNFPLLWAPFVTFGG